MTSIAHIKQAVALEFGVTVAELEGPGLGRAQTVPRQIAMYLCRVECGRSYRLIARYFGARHHTTVMDGVRRAVDHVHADERTAARVGRLRTRWSA